MSYFSRLTDIVTCNLSKILSDAEDPRAAIAEIVTEMEEGLSGAERSVNAANANEQRLRREIEDLRASIASWTNKAREQLAAGQEADARQSLMRKREVDDLLGGLEQQHKSALATIQNLATTQRALHARLAEALRAREELGVPPEETPNPVSGNFTIPSARPMVDDRMDEVDAELEAMKRELGT